MSNKINIGLDLDETLIITTYRDGYFWDLIEGVYEWLLKLYEKYDLHIITARSDLDNTLEIVNKIEEKLNIKFQSVNCIPLPNKKINIMKKLNCKFFIDDKYYNVKDCYTEDIKGILFYQYTDENNDDYNYY